MAALKSVNIAQAKAQLPTLVERVARGEEIVIASNGKPKARQVKSLLLDTEALIRRAAIPGAGSQHSVTGCG